MTDVSDQDETPRSPEPSSRSSLEAAGGERARSIAEALLSIGAIQLRPTNPFVWSSGLAAPIYCDNRLSLSYPRIRRLICEGFADVMTTYELLPSTIVGTATAGIAHAAWLADDVDQPMAYVRSSAKEHGTEARIEGVVQEGDDVVVVEDLISTGSSALDAVATLRERGATVRAVLAIFTYDLDASEAAFREAEVNGHVLTDFWTLIDVAHAHDQLSEEDLHVLKDWRSDPAAWSLNRGGVRPD